MSLFTKLANYIFSPVDASGAQRSVLNADAQVWGTEIERLIMALVAEQGGDIDLPNLLIRFTVTGGTANDIEATANLPIPTEPGLALFSIQIAQDNTGPVTINGKPWLTNVGNQFVAGGIKAGGIYLFLDNGDHYRAVTDQDVSALVAVAEAAAAEAKSAAGEATGRALVYPATGDQVYEAGNRRIGDIADPVDDQDAVNRRSVLIKAGGAFLAGGLPISGLADGVDPSDAATVGQVSRLRGGHKFITLPPGFDWPSNGRTHIGREPFSIIRDRAGNYRSSFNFRLAPSIIGRSASSKRIYVSTEGRTENDGSAPDKALSTIDEAFGKLESGYPAEIVLAPGDYINAWTGNTPNMNFGHIHCPTGRARIITGVIPSVWTSVGTGVYSASVSSSWWATVVSVRLRDEFGFPLALTRYESLSDLQNSGSEGFAHVGGTMYIRLPHTGSTWPVPGGGDIYVLLPTSSPTINSGFGYLLENMEFWGGGLGLALNGETGVNSNAFVAAANCDFAYSAANGVTMWNLRGGAWFKDCRAFRNRLDGFNGHDDRLGEKTMWIEDHCIALGNGLNISTANNQGSTAHDYSRVIRVGGFYGFGRGQSVADIDWSQSFNVGCTFDGSVAGTSVGAHLTGSAEGWFDDCYIGGNTLSLRASDDAIIRVRDCVLDGPTLLEGNGEILPY